MKTIALLAVKNEEWILPTYISAMKDLADIIIAIDDGSTDNSRKILEDAGAKVYANSDVVSIGYFNEFLVREKLIELGRQHGGTHFICLDADEAFTSNLRSELKDIMRQMIPGQKIHAPWISLWKSNHEYRNDEKGAFHTSLKDFVFCDDKVSHHPYAYIGVSRCPKPEKEPPGINLPFEKGGVLHFQFTNWKNNELKQAWYRCAELINGKRSARRINVTYSHLFDTDKAKIYPTPKEWTVGLTLPTIDYATKTWHLEEIIKSFDKLGITFFEPLQIWHIPELRTEFVSRVGREPKPVITPTWILRLNDIKNKVKNLYR